MSSRGCTCAASAAATTMLSVSITQNTTLDHGLYDHVAEAITNRAKGIRATRRISRPRRHASRSTRRPQTP